MEFLAGHQGLSSGIAGAAAILLTVGVLGLTVPGIVAASVLGPAAYLGTDLLIRARATGAMVGQSRGNSLQTCLALQAQVQNSLGMLPAGDGARNQIEGIASVSEGIIAAMRRDPSKMDDISNFNFNYMQPVAKAVQTYASLSQEQLPGGAGESVKTRLASLFPKALTQLKKYQDTMYAGDVQQLEGLVGMLEDSFPDEPAAAGGAKQ